jgi:hypothetical protein
MEDNMNQEPETHESYGIISISRVSSQPPVNLFGSSIRHGHYITLKISTARKRRDFQKDRYNSVERLIEVDLSATQFANVITSFNVGDGVPCTLNYVKGDKGYHREKCPEINFKQQATKELKEEMADLGKRLDNLKKDSVEILNGKGAIKVADRKKLLEDLRMIDQEIRSNIPYVHECFNESVETTITEAKGEIDATFQTIRERLGDSAIKIEVPMLESN